ncbi:MAG: cytochrome c [Bdellovibrionaceae bacterium]|nr:cytochrome c [Bdellovibrio sp.]
MAENHDHHNQRGLIAFLGSMAFVFIFFFYIVFINKGVELNENVSDPAPADAPKYDLLSEKEPWLPKAEVVTAGQKLFKQNCALCHGQNGDLVGGIANARHLVDGQWKVGNGMIAHFKVLQNGIAGTQMASFKQTLKPGERWAILNYIETITKNKSTDKTEDIATFAKSAD